MLMLEHSVNPGARKIQEKLNLMRQDSKFSTIRAEDFRNGALLENVMGALSEPSAYVCPILSLALGHSSTSSSTLWCFMGARQGLVMLIQLRSFDRSDR